MEHHLSVAFLPHVDDSGDEERLGWVVGVDLHAVTILNLEGAITEWITQLNEVGEVFWFWKVKGQFSFFAKIVFSVKSLIVSIISTNLSQFPCYEYLAILII